MKSKTKTKKGVPPFQTVKKTYFRSRGRAWETKRFPNGIRKADFVRLRKKGSFKAFWRFSRKLMERYFFTDSIHLKTCFQVKCRLCRHAQSSNHYMRYCFFILFCCNIQFFYFCKMTLCFKRCFYQRT